MEKEHDERPQLRKEIRDLNNSIKKNNQILLDSVVKAKELELEDRKVIRNMDQILSESLQ